MPSREEAMVKWSDDYCAALGITIRVKLTVAEHMNCAQDVALDGDH